MTDGADRGRQAERTVLAHLRTMFAAAVAGLLIIRQSGGGAERAVAVAGAFAALLTIAGVGFRRRAAFDRGDTAVSPRAVVGVVAAVVLMQVVALVVVL